MLVVLAQLVPLALLANKAEFRQARENGSFVACILPCLFVVLTFMAGEK